MHDLLRLVHMTATRFLGYAPPVEPLDIQGAHVHVQHDGNDYAPFFNPAYGNARALRFMAAALEQVGYYAQQHNAWHTTLHRL